MRVFGIIGDQRVEKSLSPRMHNRVLRQHGIDGLYVGFAVEKGWVGEAVTGLRALNIEGVNVTVPHKEAVARHLDRLEGDAAELGVVNTVLRRGEELIGHNTDARGLAEAIERTGHKFDGHAALVLGAGGAARAAAHALGKLGCCEVIMAGRDLSKVEPVAEGLGVTAVSFAQAPKQLSSVSLLINATSVSSPVEGPDLAAWVMNLPGLPAIRLVVDLNYGRKENVWWDLASRAQADFMDGLPMLACQACLSFSLWTGIDAAPEEFLSVLGVPS